MATYNGAKFIREQIDSILNQTIQDFELVICDDCSTDETLSILKEYAKNDNRIRAYDNECNLGFKKNFENAICKCKGDYIALSDQDDIWLPKHLEILLNQMVGDIQLACGSQIFVNERNEELPKRYDYLRKDFVPDNDEDMARHIFLCRSTYQGASMLLKKSFLDIALPIPEGAEFHDSWFAALACSVGCFTFVDEPVMRYRRIEDAVTSSNMKPTPARLFIASVLVDHSVKDRLTFIENIRKRLPGLSLEKEKLLNTFEKLLKRRNTIWGRIANVPYLIKHFKAIYCYDGKHLFTI